MHCPVEFAIPGLRYYYREKTQAFPWNIPIQRYLDLIIALNYSELREIASMKHLFRECKWNDQEAGPFVDFDARTRHEWWYHLIGVWGRDESDAMPSKRPRLHRAPRQMSFARKQPRTSKAASMRPRRRQKRACALRSTR